MPLFIPGIFGLIDPTDWNTIPLRDGWVYTMSAADVFYFGDADIDEVRGSDSADIISGGGSGDVIDANGGNDTVYGDGGEDLIHGRAGNDWLYGGEGRDTIYGGTDNDFLYGEGQQDNLFGSSGNDILNGGAGPDLINGGFGNDTASYSRATAAVRVFMDRPAFNEGEAMCDVLISIENLEGSLRFGDWLEGNGEANVIDGLGGNDWLFGYGGNDTIRGGSGTDRLVGHDGDDILVGGGGGDVFMGGTDYDFAILPGRRSDYTFAHVPVSAMWGPHYELTRTLADGTREMNVIDYHVEVVQFSDGGISIYL
jgi:Ca2+-binding RTX toxin-like protein